MKRYQTAAILRDLDKKMVLLAGPRQAGKTTLAKSIAEGFQSSVYLNYDRLEDRRMMRDSTWPISSELLIFDEIHKMPEWKNYLKGIYDTKPPHQKILVTGSARIEIFNQVGDSLAGRFFLHRLLPLSPAELTRIGEPYSLDRFLERGPFPEPYLADNLIDAKRWRLQYTDSLLRGDVLDFDNIQNLKSMQLVFDLLRSKVGSPISYKSISEDASISPNTVKKYIQILEALYIVFRVTPYANNIARSLQKEPKIYFFDTGLVNGDEGVQFENFVASCLLKHVYSRIDYLGEPYALHFLKTKEGKEVDFALIHNDKIEQIIEVKKSDAALSKSLVDFHQKYDIPAVQIVKNLRIESQHGDIQIVQAHKFLEMLDL